MRDGEELKARSPTFSSFLALGDDVLVLLSSSPVSLRDEVYWNLVAFRIPNLDTRICPSKNMDRKNETL